MNEKLDYYYKILGLQPGAAPDEIKAAYRKLVKFYHPDRCQSPDTQIMYREIYTAYKALLEQPITGKAGSESIVNRYTSEWMVHTDSHTKKARQSTTDSRDLSEQATWTSEDWDDWARKANWASEDWVKEYDNSGDRLPFKLINLPFIFCRSLKEMCADGFLKFLLEGYLMVLFALVSLMPLQHNNLAVCLYIASWVSFVFFRYYFAPSNWTLSKNLIAAILYAAIFVVLIACFHAIPVDDLITACFFVSLSAWLMFGSFYRYGDKHVW